MSLPIKCRLMLWRIFYYMLESIKIARNYLKETKHDATQLNSTPTLNRTPLHAHTHHTHTHNADVRRQRAPSSRHYRHVRAYVKACGSSGMFKGKSHRIMTTYMARQPYSSQLCAWQNLTIHRLWRREQHSPTGGRTRS